MVHYVYFCSAAYSDGRSIRVDSHSQSISDRVSLVRPKCVQAAASAKGLAQHQAVDQPNGRRCAAAGGAGRAHGAEMRGPSSSIAQCGVSASDGTPRVQPCGGGGGRPSAATAWLCRPSPPRRRSPFAIRRRSTSHTPPQPGTRHPAAHAPARLSRRHPPPATPTPRPSFASAARGAAVS